MSEQGKHPSAKALAAISETQAPTLLRRVDELVEALGKIRDMTQCDYLTDEHKQCITYENILTEISKMVDETIGEHKKEPT